MFNCSAKESGLQMDGQIDRRTVIENIKSLQSDRTVSLFIHFLFCVLVLRFRLCADHFCGWTRLWLPVGLPLC